MKRHAPATARNRQPILDVLRPRLPARGLVLEIASGSGEHIVYFAGALPGLVFQPSDPSDDARASIDDWVLTESLGNVRPALALDLMEEFRPILADSTAIGMVNTGEIGPEHFVRRGPSCNLTDTGRRRVLEAWERRLDTLVTHPVFGYRISYRRVFEVQTRLLARHLLGEIPDLPPFLVR